MPVRFREHPWQSQPQEGAEASAKWISRGMVALFDCRSGVELISGARASVDAIPRLASQAGVGADFSSAAMRWTHRPAFAVTGPLSIFVYCDIDALSSFGALIAKQGTTTTNAPFELRMGLTSTDANLNILRADGSGQSSRSTGSNVLSAGAKSARIIVSGTGKDFSGFAYVNGSKFFYGGAGTGTPTDNGADVWIGRRFDGATQLDGRIFHIGLFAGQLSDDYALELDSLPNDVFEPQRIWAPVVAATSTDPTGLAQAAGQASATSSTTNQQGAAAQAAGQALATSASTSSQAGAAQAAGQAFGASASTTRQTAIAQAAAQALGVDASTVAGTSIGLAQAAGQALAAAAATALQLGLAQAGAQALATSTSVALQAGQAQAAGQALGQVITAQTITATGMAAGGAEAFAATGGASVAAPDYPLPRAPARRKKVTVIHKDDTAEREAEFEELLARVKGQGSTKGRAAAKRAATGPLDASVPAFEPPSIPRMPEVTGVPADALRRWMPELLAAFRVEYRTGYADQLQGLMRAAAHNRALIEDEEEVAILAALL